jgi:hypothetical protein
MSTPERIRPRFFSGSDYVPHHDYSRLKGQIKRIHDFMADGGWYTKREIAQATGAPEGSVGAQLQNLRKEPLCHRVDKRPRGDRSQGLWEYKMHAAGTWEPRQQPAVIRAEQAERHAQALAMELRLVSPHSPVLLDYVSCYGELA